LHDALKQLVNAGDQVFEQIACGWIETGQ